VSSVPCSSIKRLLLSLRSVFFLSSVSAANLASPVGRWRTIDDETNAERSIVEIVQVGDELQGKIVQLLNRQPGRAGGPSLREMRGWA
jgi:hypothetical protein